MKKYLVIALCVSSVTLLADWGFWDATRSYVQFHEKQSGVTVTNTYSLWDSGTGTFDGHDFGTFNPVTGDELVMLLYDTKTWKNSGGDVTGCTYFVTTYEKDNRGAPTWTNLGGGWLEDIDASGNQKWGVASMEVDILALASDITNKVEIYGQVGGTTPDTVIYDNNNSDIDNYSADFMIIPEPTGIIAGVFALGIMLRKRI